LEKSFFDMALADTLSSLKNLQNFHLWLNQTKVEDLSVHSLCLSLKSFGRNLECLSLGFDGTKVTDEGISKLGTEIAPEVKSLKEFRLWVSKTLVGDAGLRPLFENLNMEKIQVLQLCLSNSRVGDQSLMALAKENLPRAESFRILEFWVRNTSISDLSMIPLMESLSNSVSDVNKLVLSCVRTKLTDWSLGMFSQEIIANLRNLRDIQFFLGQSQTNGTKVDLFMDNLALKVQNIQKFELELSNPVMPYNIRTFADKVLPKMTNIQDFKLFWNASLSTLTYQALCLNAKKVMKNIKTFDIRPSSFVSRLTPHWLLKTAFNQCILNSAR